MVYGEECRQVSKRVGTFSLNAAGGIRGVWAETRPCARKRTRVFHPTPGTSCVMSCGISLKMSGRFRLSGGEPYGRAVIFCAEASVKQIEIGPFYQ